MSKFSITALNIKNTFCPPSFKIDISRILPKANFKFSAMAVSWLLIQNIICTPCSIADMITLPLPLKLKNNIVLLRAGESFADSRHEVQTNPVRKLRQDNALTMKGREQIIEAAKEIETKLNFQPSYIWVSNTERAYESAVVLAREIQLGQNRIVPEFSFLDARAAGIYEGTNDETTWEEIHKNDEVVGLDYKPPTSPDGTPCDSVNNVLVRVRQLISTIEGMYSGENVVVVSPDSEILSILEAALSNNDPDKALLTHFKYSYRNGEFRLLQPYIEPVDNVLVTTGQSKSDIDKTNRKMKAALVSGSGRKPSLDDEGVVKDWFDLWSLSVDHTPEVIK